MAKRGPKCKYEDSVKPYLERIPKWRRQGLTEKQIAKKLKIAYSSLSTFKNNFPELAEALREGKEELIENLEGSLYKRALGYEIEETKETVDVEQKGYVKDKQGNFVKDKEDNLIPDIKSKKVKKEKIKKHIPADTGAICFALKNLSSDKWKDKSELKHSGDKENPVEVVQVYIPDNKRQS